MSNLLEEKEKYEADWRASKGAEQMPLYHGTSYPFPLQALKPQLSQIFATGAIGQYVFATPHFLYAATYTAKIPGEISKGDYFGIRVIGGFGGTAESKYPGKETVYALVNRYEEFEKSYLGGQIYGLRPDDFLQEANGEFIATKPVNPSFSIAVNGLNDLMEAGVQLFALHDNYEATIEIHQFWRQLVRLKWQAPFLKENSKPGGSMTWLNKDLGIPIPEGPMSDW